MALVTINPWSSLVEGDECAHIPIGPIVQQIWILSFVNCPLGIV